MGGQATLEGPIEEVARMEALEAKDLLDDLGIVVQPLISHCHLHCFMSRYSLSMLVIELEHEIALEILPTQYIQLATNFNYLNLPGWYF